MAIIRDSIDILQIGDLLDYCSSVPEIYNETANRLNERFGIRGAEIALLVTYFVAEERKGKHD